MEALNIQPKFVEATREIDTLNSALAKVRGRIIEIEALLYTDAPEGDSSHVAAALEFAATGVVRGPDNTPTALREEHLVLRQQAEALRNVIGERYLARDRLAGELSAAAVADARPKHDEMLARYVKKLLELDAMRQEEIDLISGIEAQGYAVNFQTYVQWPHLGSARDAGSAFASRLRELGHRLA